MKARICANGTLQLDRGVKSQNWKPMICPFTSEDHTFCGDWCPHFGGMEFSSRPYHFDLQLCHGRVLVIEQSSFIDERL